MTTENDTNRIRPAPVVIAGLLLDLLDQLYDDRVQAAPEGPERDIVVIQWARFRDEYKPLLERIIHRGR